MKFKKIILDILFPISCLGCCQSNVWLCEECQNKIQINKDLFQPINFSPSYIDGFFVSADWEDKILKDTVHRFKYGFAKELAEPLSKLMIKKIYKLNIELKNFVIFPVPLHRRRLAWRGFNQAELLASFVAEKFNLELNNNLLIRKKYTSPQTKLNSKKRKVNILNAFEIKKSVSFENILLIDDVITTGATINEIARVLKNNGTKKVFGIALARG